ncbi:MAG: adenosylmethionine--8-amino-7-oxononanoate transaminase [Candidatus Omnitrophota bacterium]|jgi:adenosylmethionine-8-amino-7-oxononanoate aminotransferase|nr:MAG: adenosylmethionine--8-amino-7-oxononanoate transaminase [Candidatus Omnitrophota bacterium]
MPAYSLEEIRQLEEWDQRFVWHPFTQMREYLQEPPLIFSQGEGVYLYDVQGNRYFDGNSSLWVAIHGHGRKELSDAIKAQLDRVAHTTLLGPANVPSIQLAKRLVEITPPSLDKVFYSDNGSTAVEIALKMAFQYWRQCRPPRMERTSYLSFREAYHGDTVGSVSVGGIELFHSIFGPLLFKHFSVPYPVYSKYTSKESPETISAQALEQCEKTLKNHAHEIAAVLIEPLVQGAAGIRTQAPGFLRGLRELCDRYEVFLITDEVFTGFGHTGKLFACEHENVTPDFMTLAKGLTGGYLPLAATMTTQQVFDGFLGTYSEFRTFFHGHTYTGNQLGCAAALASLDLFEKDNTLERLQPLIIHFEKKLDDLFERCDAVADIHQIGLVAGIDLCRSRRRQEFYTLEERVGAKICFDLRKYGIWLRPLGNTLVLVPPLISTAEQLDHLIFSIEHSLDGYSVA